MDGRRDVGKVSAREGAPRTLHTVSLPASLPPSLPALISVKLSLKVSLGTVYSQGSERWWGSRECKINVNGWLLYAWNFSLLEAFREIKS